ncbi:hypothetical protein LINPERPRIM_LOCUS25999 [Linum perenne]
MRSPRGSDGGAGSNGGGVDDDEEGREMAVVERRLLLAVTTTTMATRKKWVVLCHDGTWRVEQLADELVQMFVFELIMKANRGSVRG